MHANLLLNESNILTCMNLIHVKIHKSGFFPAKDTSFR